jgi:Arm DNA-binding domain
MSDSIHLLPEKGRVYSGVYKNSHRILYPQMPLTDSACKAAKPKDKPYKLTDGDGMFLYVHPNGYRYWRLKYRYLGKEKLLSFGGIS